MELPRRLFLLWLLYRYLHQSLGHKKDLQRNSSNNSEVSNNNEVAVRSRERLPKKRLFRRRRALSRITN